MLAAFLVALLTERCLFVDFPFYNTYFAHELDFSWERHSERLLAFGHNASAPENKPYWVGYGWQPVAEDWMFSDIKKLYSQSYGVELYHDLDWRAPLFQSNPIYTVRCHAPEPWLCSSHAP
jgi:xyloglucan fucosyltransferase